MDKFSHAPTLMDFPGPSGHIQTTLPSLLGKRTRIIEPGSATCSTGPNSDLGSASGRPPKRPATRHSKACSDLSHRFHKFATASLAPAYLAAEDRVLQPVKFMAAGPVAPPAASLAVSSTSATPAADYRQLYAVDDACETGAATPYSRHHRHQRHQIPHFLSSLLKGGLRPAHLQSHGHSHRHHHRPHSAHNNRTGHNNNGHNHHHGSSSSLYRSASFSSYSSPSSSSSLQPQLHPDQTQHALFQSRLQDHQTAPSANNLFDSHRKSYMKKTDASRPLYPSGVVILSSSSSSSSSSPMPSVSPTSSAEHYDGSASLTYPSFNANNNAFPNYHQLQPTDSFLESAKRSMMAGRPASSSAARGDRHGTLPANSSATSSHAPISKTRRTLVGTRRRRRFARYADLGNTETEHDADNEYFDDLRDAYSDDADSDAPPSSSRSSSLSSASTSSSSRRAHGRFNGDDAGTILVDTTGNKFLYNTAISIDSFQHYHHHEQDLQLPSIMPSGVHLSTHDSSRELLPCDGGTTPVPAEDNTSAAASASAAAAADRRIPAGGPAMSIGGTYNFRNMRMALADVNFPSLRDPDLVEITLDEIEKISDYDDE